MLTWLIGACLRHRIAVILAALGVVVWGVWSWRHLPLDAFPDTTPIQVQVHTPAAALSAEEVERQVSAPVEQALSGLPGLLEVRSLSRFGLSQITLTFDDSLDLLTARQLVSERLASVDLPDAIPPPRLGPMSTGLGEVFQYVLRSQTLSAEELRTLHHWVIRPRMVQVPGVAEINTWGGLERQLHVLVNPDALLRYGLTLDDLARALAESNRNVSGGVIARAGEALVVQGSGLLTSAAQIEGLVVAQRDGVPIRVRELARVEVGHAVRHGAVTARGEGEVVLGLGFTLAGAHSGELTRRLEARLDEVRAELPQGVTVEAVYNRSFLVDEVLGTVRRSLLEGAALVVLVLCAFLGSLRAGLVVAVTIPLAMCFAAGLMVPAGVVGSLMSLGALDFGLVVDSSVIMVENAERHLALERNKGRSVADIVREAAVEVRKPTLFGELIIAAVYLPILALEGVEGKLFAPMALTVIFALAGSMICSMTLTPALASLALSARPAHQPNALVRWLTRGYTWLLDRALASRPLVLALALLAVINAGWLAARLGTEFVPRLQEQAVVINTVRMAGISLEESVRYGTQIERLLLKRFPDEIAHIWTRTGSAEVATDPMGFEVSDVFITLTPRDQWRAATTQQGLVAAMDRALDGMPGMRRIFTQPIELRVNEMTAGVRADVGVKLFGDDLAALDARAQQLARAIEQLPGAADVTAEQLTGQPVLRVEVDVEGAGRHGVSVAEVLGIIEALGPREVGEVVEGQRRWPLAVRLDHEASAQSVAQLEAMRVLTSAGGVLPLGALARVSIAEGPSALNREWGKRRVLVQANVRGRDVGSFVQDVRGLLAQLTPLPGYHAEIGGQFEHYERARDRLMWVIPAALLLICGLLYLTYGRVRDVARVFTGVPFGVVGGVVALWARDMPFSISAGVGFVALSGVAVLGDMVLVSRIKQLVAQGLDPDSAIREAAITRLRPVLMTGLVAALGFVPMALNTGVGAEVQRPLATVVIGGLVTSTAATLLLLPLLYSLFGAGAEARAEDDTP